MATSVVLIAHGSRAPGTVESHERTAAELALALGRPVRPAFLELTPPDIPTAIGAAVADGADEVLLVPYFLLHGNHTLRDIPEIIAAARLAHPGVRIGATPPLGPDPRLIDIAADRVAAALTAGGGSGPAPAAG